MKTRKNNEEKSKSKLSLQKKKSVAKTDLKSILSVSHNVLNETCEFRQSSSVKEQKSTVCQVVVSEPENKLVDVDTDNCKKCPTCELSFPREAFQHHVTECLKERFQKKETSEDVVPQEKFSCQFCLKDLSHYNSARKTQHLNRCMDQVEELKQKEMQKKVELEQARIAVLDCPMCGRTLKSENGRKVHMKKCSQNLGVSTDQLLDLIRKQEEERQINIAAGVVPQSVKTGISNSKLNKQAKKQKLKEPNSKYDEELQTALALSNSLHNSESSKKTEIQPLKQGKKKKTESAPPPLLVVLTEEEKWKRWSDRVATMLIPQEVEDEEEDVEYLTPVLSESQVKDKYSNDNNQFPSLWTRCELATDRLTCLEKKDTFYVERLMPPIAVSRFVVGSNIKKMEDIPGRRKSSYRALTKKQEANLGTTDAHGDTLLASTQTAVVLAELEVSAMATPDLDLTCSGFCPDSPIRVQESTKQKVSENHQKKMASLVNNHVLSDLKIKASDGTIHAHRLILNVKCPNVIQNCKDELMLTDFATDTVLTVMKFLYAGIICLPKGMVQEVKDLAARLEITDLVEICSSVIDKKKEEDRIEDKTGEEEEQKERNFTDLTEDDREGDPGETEGCSSDNNDWEKLSDRDYNDIRLTQRKKYSHSDEGGREEDSGGSVVDPEERKSDVSEEEIALFFHDDSFDGTYVKPSEDNDGLEEKSEIKDMEAFPDDGVSNEDHSVRKENLMGGREEKRKKDKEDTEEEIEEDMEIDQVQEEGNEESAEENNEEHIVQEKHADSILYQDEDVIIYSETEDTPPCLGSDKFRQSAEQQVLDKSGRASSPLVVDSDSSHDGSPERDVSAEGNDGEVGSPNPQALDSSGLDLFESPVLSRLDPEADPDMQASTIRDPAASEENRGCGTPGRKHRKTKTSVEGSHQSESKRCIRYSDQENNTCEFSCPQQDDDPRSESVDDNTKCNSRRNKVTTPKTSVTSTNSGNDDDEVSVIEDKCQVLSAVGSPVFGQQQSNERKTFRFTKTKPVKVNLRQVLSPEKSEEPVVICHVDQSPPEAASSSQHYQEEEEQVPEVVENDLELNEPDQDVWEDFNDSGMGGCIVTCDVPIPSQSPNRNEGKCDTPIKPTNPVAKLDTPTNSKPGLKHNSLPPRPEDQLMEENIEDDSFDVEMVEEQETDNLNSFKTPNECRRPKRSKKDWVPPSPFTPMPSYDSMATPQLKREVQKIGVKPVGKKRMVLLLKDIYHQTHQYETDSEFEISVDETTAEQSKQGGPISVSDEEEEEEISSSQESDGSVVLEESMIEEEETTASQAGSSSSDLTQRITQFILDTPDLYTRVLMYEPLEIDVLKREITEAGIKCSMEKLLNYLDEKCITFTMKNRRKNSPKKGRGRGRKKKTAEPE